VPLASGAVGDGPAFKASIAYQMISRQIAGENKVFSLYKRIPSNRIYVAPEGGGVRTHSEKSII
jgi:hypothetical protein